MANKFDGAGDEAVRFSYSDALTKFVGQGFLSLPAALANIVSWPQIMQNQPHRTLSQHG